MTNGKTGKSSTEIERKTYDSERKEFIKRFGKERFDKLVEVDRNFKKYKEPEIPIGHKWLFSQFLYIWFHAERDMMGNVIFTFRTINEYQQCMKIPFTLVEKTEMLKMASWASEVLYELNK